MRTFRECDRCHKKYDDSAFKNKTSSSCRPCDLMLERLSTKFNEMLASPDTGLSELDVYLNSWYGVS